MKNIYNLITYPILLFLSNLLFRLNNRLNIWDNKLNGGVVSKLFDYSRTDSADYFKEFMSEIMIFDNRKDFWDYSISKTRDQGIVLEFGVYKGNSINYMSKKLNNTNFFGFDSFEGLQEDWKGNYMRKGYFNVYGKLPKVNKNVKLFKGWFKNTLPVFLKSNEDERMKNNEENQQNNHIDDNCRLREAVFRQCQLGIAVQNSLNHAFRKLFTQLAGENDDSLAHLVCHPLNYGNTS